MRRLCALVVWFATAAAAQNPNSLSLPQTVPQRPTVQTTVVVVGAPDALSEAESARSTAPLDVQPTKLVYADAQDLLRSDDSVDIEERGNGGVQADVTIRGGSFEQTLVLLNGLRINDSQTSHFNLDLPMVTDALASVNVLHGAGSALYGSDAVAGVVDFVTAAPAPGFSLLVRAGGGSFGTQEQTAVASWGGKSASEVLAGGRDFSDGFIADRDYRSEEASSETRARSVLGESDLLVAASDREYGANQFYGNYNSYERTKGWFAALSQQIDAKTQAAVAYRRHTDEFILLRNDPAAYENNHIDTSWQGAVRRKEILPLKGTALFYGLEANTDEIHSNSLGDHGRNRGAGYLGFEWLGDKWGTLSAGAREEIFGGGTAVFTPDVAVSTRLRRNVKLRAATGRGFRLPTYTDLYYSDPATVGNPKLKSESAWNFEGGADWYASAKLALSFTAFHSIQTNAIDYVRVDATQKWQATNLSGLHFNGTETTVDWRPIAGQEFRVGLTTLAGAQSALNGLQSEYVFNYPLQNASVEWIGRWKNGLMLRQRLRVVDRIDRSVYPVWDASASYEGNKRVQPYVRATNLSNTNYQEIVGVQNQTRAFVAGVQCVLGRRN